MAKLNNNFVAVLDIGSTKVVCFIAKITNDNEINVVGIGHQVSQGIKSGIITDIKLAEQSIRSAVGTAEQIAGVTVERVIVNISGHKQKSHIVKAELDIKGQEVTNRDIGRIITQGCERYKTEGREIIHCIPLDYAIDGTSGIKCPLGMYGNLLSANLHIITATSSTIMNLTNCLAQCHLNIEGYVASSYASGFACLSEDEKELGVILLDFGGSNVAIAVFKGGNIIYTNTVAYGGMHITNDLAIGLSTNIETAERVKTLHGNVLSAPKDEQEMIDIPQISEDGTDEMNHIQKSMLVSITKPRVEEILEKVKNCLKKDNLDTTGGYIVITGGGSQLGGLGELTGQIFNKQTRIGMPKNIDAMAESTKGPAFSTSTGMLFLAAKQRANKYDNFNAKNLIASNFLGKIVIWLRENF